MGNLHFNQKYLHFYQANPNCTANYRNNEYGNLNNSLKSYAPACVFFLSPSKHSDLFFLLRKFGAEKSKARRYTFEKALFNLSKVVQ